MSNVQHPINNIEWVSVNDLNANDYNPNIVLTDELKLLKYNMLKHGWIQPILAGTDRVIIDGFHRTPLTKTDPDLFAMTEGKVPVSFLDLDTAERIMLTVRINRAKGTHAALKMHDLVNTLHNDHQILIADIAKGIGASHHEVETLLKENVFVAKDVANKPYSKAWLPNRGGVNG